MSNLSTIDLPLIPNNGDITDSGCGEKSQRVIIEGSKVNVLDALNTTLNSSATKIEFPEKSCFTHVYHVAYGEYIYLTGNSLLTAASLSTATDYIALPANFPLPMEFTKGNDNTIYGLIASGQSACQAFTYGMFKE